MLDLSGVAGFDWDDGNTRKSADKHSVSQKEAEEVFLDPKLLVLADVKHSLAEKRYHALGETPMRHRLIVTFTMRGHETLIRIISARPMNRKEQIIYDEEA